MSWTDVLLQSPIEQLDRAAEAAVRRLKAYHPSSPSAMPPREHGGASNNKRSRAGAYIRREEARMAMWAKREWSGLQGFTQEEQVMMDVSDLGNGQTAEDGIPLGEGWLLQLAGVDVSGRRKSLGLSKKNEGEVLRDFGLPLLLHSEEGRRWHEALASLPQTPLGREEQRRSSRHSIGSLELFVGTDTDFSTATCPQMSPRPTLYEEELEVFNVWTGQLLPSSPEHCEHCLVVAPQTSLPQAVRRPSFFRRRCSSETSGSRPEDDMDAASTSSGMQSLVLPSLDGCLTGRGSNRSSGSLEPDKSPLYRRRKAILSGDSVTSIANLSTSDGSGY